MSEFEIYSEKFYEGLDEVIKKVEEEKPVIKYPDGIPNINDVDILELDQEYFIDSHNNVYQMTEDQEIGIFLGFYDKKNKCIVPIN